jgi:hypothetical protein
MYLFPRFLSLTAIFLLPPFTSQIPNIPRTSADFALPCYNTPIPSLPPSVSNENRTTPWGSPSFILPNGTLCCDSLTQIRDGIDDLDAQILQLLAQRAGFVREATRFKSTLSGKLLRMMRSERDEWVLRLNRCRCSITRRGSYSGGCKCFEKYES